ncbi:MAG TPA: hypothetical protein PKC97_14245 [Burkholderiaceae bacterium]|nr:hypothetical protein [Burkholderiaceae bacterium]
MRALLLSIAAVALLGAVMLALLVFALHGLAPDGLHVVINDRELSFGHLPPLPELGAGLGGLLAVVAAAIVIPVALLLGVLLPLLLLAGALLLLVGLALGVGAISMAPLVLPLLLLVWLWRRAQRRKAAAAQEAARARAASDTIDL